MIESHVVVGNGEYQHFSKWTVEALVELGVIVKGETCVLGEATQTYYYRNLTPPEVM